ncbi:MAG: type II secretion system protein [Bacteriovoracia bacterium]
MRKRQAFTFIELLIVIGIISVIAAALIPIAFNALNQAKATNILNYIRELYMAQLEYFVSNGETTDLNGLSLYIPSDWIEEQEELFTTWATDTNTVSFTVAFDNSDRARGLLAMLEDTKVCTSTFDDTKKNVIVAFQF